MCWAGVGASKRQWCPSIQCHLCALVIKKHWIYSVWCDSRASGLGGTSCPSEPWFKNTSHGRQGLSSLLAKGSLTPFVPIQQDASETQWLYCTFHSPGSIEKAVLRVSSPAFVPWMPSWTCELRLLLSNIILHGTSLSFWKCWSIFPWFGLLWLLR